MKKALRVIAKVEEILALIGVIAFTITIFLGAITRCFGHPLNWTASAALFIFAWTAFLCGDVAFRNGRLVNLDLIICKFPMKAQKAIAVLVYLIICTFLAIIIYQGIRICPTSWHRTFNGEKGFSYFWVALSIPVCFSLILLTAVERLVNILKCKDVSQISKM